MMRRFLQGAVLSGVSLLAFGCDDPIQTGPAPTAPLATVDPNAATPAEGTTPEGEGEDSVLRNYQDEDFLESPGNRDPFRNYAVTFRARNDDRPVRENVIMPNVPVDSMRLSAIITGTAIPRAMLVDPEGVGHTVRRGDYVGRPEVVQTAGETQMPVTLNWRVERIRDNEVVISRDDPTAADRPPLTRVIPLYDETEERP
ncbi:MAG: hypothetical protein AAGF12_01595 [Myxococcota bacterium]